ncbi:MAG: FAD-binding protein, partial [Anaerolineae bacterium]|nr:FAD-binding protein [Anaerolineae bacterium]
MLRTLPKISFVTDPWVVLQSRLQGTVITPDHLQYDQARQAWNLSVDQRPAGIVVPKNATDVVEAVRFARSEGLGIAVQATGHGNVRPANDCLLILTSDMQGVTIDATSQTAWVEAGVKWEVVLEKAQAVGLAPLLGSSPDVGAVGYTLGG